jgi:multiple sugar transport system ATP-binding protein
VRQPLTLYREPGNLFVAGFIGSPAMNPVRCDATVPVHFGRADLDLSAEATAAVGAAGATGADEVVLGFRPESVVIGDGGDIKAEIRMVENLGSEVFVHVAVAHGSDDIPIVSKMAAPFPGRPGASVSLRVFGAVHVFDPVGPRLATSPAHALRGVR